MKELLTKSIGESFRDSPFPGTYVTMLTDENGRSRRESEWRDSFWIPETEILPLFDFSPKKESLESFLSHSRSRFHRLSFQVPQGLCRIFVATEFESSLLQLPRGSALIVDGRRKAVEKETALLMSSKRKICLTEYEERSALCRHARWIFPLFQLEYKLHG